MTRRRNRFLREFSLVALVSIVCAWILAFLDAFDWFYIHSRKHEAYEYDDIVTFMTLFWAFGLLWLSIRRHKETKREVAKRRESEEALGLLNAELESRVQRRTSQLQAELDERKRAEGKLLESQKELQSLSSELSLAEERERRRIAADLHDSIGHTLAIARNKLGTLRPSLSSAHDKQLLNDIEESVITVIRHSRSLIFELSSPLFYDSSFVSAVQWLARDTAGKSGIAVHLQADDDPAAPVGDVRVLFLKAIKEILMNVVKHARAQNIEISIRTERGDKIVEIRDDGIGFDALALSQISTARHQGFGTFTVRERLKHLNGRFSIVSKLGQGTTVTIAVPVQSETPGSEP